VKKLYTLHQPDREKLEGVIEEVRERGAPSIRVVNCGDYCFALEGVHRLAACAALGIAPHFEWLEPSAPIDTDSLDWPHLTPGNTYTAGELARPPFSTGCAIHSLLDDGTLANR
jgi:hypothetical protein